MLDAAGTGRVIESYQNQAEQLLKEYLLADTFVPYTSVIGGVLACKLVYDLTQLLSALYFKSYLSLPSIKRVEWNNRAISTVHAIFITAISLYLVFWSDLYTTSRIPAYITHRSSLLSIATLGGSVGYFVADLAMIFWFYPSLGGLEYVVHHFLSVSAIAYSMLTAEGQLYTFMVLISETTTPGINLRWFEEVQSVSFKWSGYIFGMAGSQNPPVHLHVLPCILAF
ncbi:TLC domain-containing protein 4-like isoform X2 [Punica granatum]|uniref:TLC domain-containing protein 4-like isoform X2 n=1 Tax=Punica granatum TaxID=22663 RepID=A0A6P8DJE6_PUNGR|nr:TLC domain-containing protein 4-like isoform X2 [Punica granatum]